MVEETSVGVGIDVEISGLQREGAEVAQTFARIVAKIGEMSAALDDAVGKSNKLGQAFAKNAADVQKTTDELKEQVRVMKAQDAATKTDKYRILNQSSDNGGTLRDDQLRKFALGAQQTSLNMSQAQIEAQLKETVLKATQRLLTTTASAITAAYNATEFRVKQQIADFTVPAALHARNVKTDAARIGMVQKYGSFSSGEEYAADQQQKKFELEHNKELLRLQKERLKVERERAAESRKAMKEAIESAAALRNLETIKSNSIGLMHAKGVKAQAASIGTMQKYGSYASGTDYVLAQTQSANADKTLSDVGRQAQIQKNSQLLEERQSKERLAVGFQSAKDVSYVQNLRLKYENDILSTVGRQAQIQKNSQLLEERQSKERLAVGFQSAKDVSYVQNLRLKYENDILSTVGRQAQIQKNSQLLEERQSKERQAVAFQSARNIQNLDTIRFNSETSIITETNKAKRLEAARYMQSQREAGVPLNEIRRTPPPEAAQPRTFGQRLGARAELLGDYTALGTMLYGTKAALQAIGDLDDGFKKFQAITQTSNSEIVGFKENLLRMGEASRYSLKDLVDVSTTLGQTGMSASAVAKAIPSVTALATASGSSLKEAVDVVTSVLGAYNMEAGRTAEVSNIMVSALNQTKLTMPQLQQGLSYSANIARDAGIGIAELTAVLGGLAQAGIRAGSTLGTGTRQLIQDLVAPSDKLKNALKPLGITMADIDIKANGLVGVLDNMRAKGFGAAEAIQALDLRAAAAFSALGGQSDTIKRLQQSLLLSNAAAEGSAKANDTLYASFTRLGNTMVGTLDRAITPVMETFKLFTNTLAGVFSVVNSLGSVLGALGGAFGALAGAGAVAGAVLAVASFRTAMLSLVAMMANPVFLALTGGLFALGLAVNLGKLANAAFSTEGRLDSLRGKLNDLQSAQGQTEQQIGSLDAMILSTIERRERLNSDPLLRRTAIIEAQQAFKDLGLSVKSNASNVDELIDALRRLRGELASELPTTLMKRLNASRDEIDLLTKQADTGQAIWARQNPRSMMERRANRVGAGDALSPVFDFMYKPNKEIDMSDIRGQSGPLVQILNGMMGDKAANPAIAAFAKMLFDQLEKRVGELNNIQGKTIGKESLESDKDVALIKDTPTYSKIKAERENMLGQLREESRAIESNTSMSAADRGQAWKDLLVKFQGLAEIRITDVKSKMRELEQAGFDPPEIQKALGEMVDLYVALGKGIVGKEMNAMDARDKALNISDAAAKDANSAAISNAVKRARNSRDTGEVARIEAEVLRLNEQQRQIEIAMAERADSDRSGLGLSDETKKKIVQINREFNEKADQFVEQLLEYRRKIVDEALGFQVDVRKREEGEVRSQIDEAKKELARTSTPQARAKELMEKLTELFKKLGDIVDSQTNTEALRQKLKERGGYETTNGSVTPGSVPDQIAATLTQLRLPELIGTAMRFASAESAFDPTAKNASGATGLFQFMTGKNGSPNTWAEAGGGDINSVEQQVKNFVTYLGVIEKTFKSVLGRAPDSDFERYLGWQQGAGGATTLLKADPNANAASVLGSTAKVVQNGGSANSTVGEFLAIIKEFFENKSVGASKYLTNADKEIEARRQAQLRRNATEIATEEASAEEVNFTREYQIIARKNAAETRADERDLQSKKAGISSAYTADDASRIVAEMISVLKGIRDKDVETFKASGEYRGMTSEQRQDRIDEINRKAAERIDKEGQGWSTSIAQKLTEEQKAIVNRLEDQKKTLEERGRPTKDVESQLLREQEKLNVLTPIAEKSREILEINRMIEAAKNTGIATEDQLSELLGKKVALEKELLVLKTKQNVIAEASKTATVGDAFGRGTEDWFKNAGLWDVKNNRFKTTTEQMSGYWAQAMGAMQNGLSSLFTNLASGTMKASEAFKKFAVSVIESMLKIASEAASKEIMKLLFGGLTSTGGASGGGILETAGKAVAGLFGAASYQGGLVRMAGGGPVPTRDSVNIYAQPGEYLLRKSAVDMIGRDQLDYVNGMGNRVNSAHAPRQMPSPAAPRKPDNVNVYVVSPDQQPVPGAKDIVAHISSDIQNRGQTFQLIRQVAIGGV